MNPDERRAILRLIKELSGKRLFTMEETKAIGSLLRQWHMTADDIWTDLR